MDCSKVGKLIFNLRKSKNMTQLDLANKLNLSDRTISKWERGLGCPDVSLLNELAEILNVNVEILLNGEMNENEICGGNMKKTKFYVCPNCSNIIWSMHESEISCCGRKLAILETKDIDNNLNITIEDIDDQDFLSIEHKMDKDNFISFVAHVYNDKVSFVKLYPEQNPEVRLPKMRNGELYIYSTQKGLLKKRITKQNKK